MLGLAGWLPWDIPEELAYFERMVEGAALVVGRLTYESMAVVPADTFVVTRQQDYVVRPGCVRVDSVEAALGLAVQTGKSVFVIGGASIYAAAWPYCERFYLTRIEQECDGDTLFPTAIPVGEWPVLSERSETYLERKRGQPVVCRFFEYGLPAPRPLPGKDCQSSPD